LALMALAVWSGINTISMPPVSCRVTVLLLSLITAVGWAQEVSHAPTNSASQSAEKDGFQTDATPVIRVSVNLVQIDATVTDAQGHTVPNLEAKDFEILQDGKPQTIKKFSYVNAPPPAALRPGPPAPTNPTKIRPEDVHRTVALVVDDLGLSFESTARVRQALKHYVDTQLQPGDLVAVLRTGAGVGALQQFTTDRRMLDAAIDRVRFNFLGGGPLGAFAPVESHLSQFPAGVNLAPTPSVDFDQERRQILPRARWARCATLSMACELFPAERFWCFSLRTCSCSIVASRVSACRRQSSN